MSRVLNVSENNYKVKVQSGGTITLDTGVAVGDVYITGNLTVSGEYTTINVSNMTVEDNVIVLNDGEGGAGITEETSGLTIDRGTLENAEFLFDETVTHYDPYSNDDINGTFVLQTADGNRSGLQLSTIAMDGQNNIYFDLKNTLNVLELENVDPHIYAMQVFGLDDAPADPEIIPTTPEDNYLLNKRYVQLYIQSGVVTPGMADVDKIYKAYPAGSSTIKSRVQATYTPGTDVATIDFYIKELLRAKINETGLTVDNVNTFGNTITNVGGSNLILTSSNNHVEVNSILNLDDQGSFPTPVNGYTQLYSRSSLTDLNQTPGRTGVFISNKVTQNAKIWNPATSLYETGKEELVSKNRALLFSILF